MIKDCQEKYQQYETIKEVIDLCIEHGEKENWDLVSKAMKILEEGFVKKIDDEAWLMVMNPIIKNVREYSEFITQKQIEEMDIRPNQMDKRIRDRIMIKKAFVTGCTGQSASYLIEKLLKEGYEVYGLYRRSTSPNFKNLKGVIENPNLKLVCGDITDPAYVFSCLSAIQPNEIYNLAAQSFVKVSFDQPIHTFDVDTVGVLNILEWVRQVSPSTKLYQASTSEMFGKSASINYDCQGSHIRYDGPISEVKKIHDNNRDYDKPFQDENTPFIPQSPYAIAKLAAHHLCRLYREAYGLFIVANITMNHESPRRGKEFVTRKITDYIGRLIANSGTPIFDHAQLSIYEKMNFHIDSNKPFPKLALGNISASRDWGHAKDFMDAAYLAMQYTIPDDYVVCTGKTNTVEGFLSIAFDYVGLDWKDYVVIDESHKRPAEVDFLNGDYSKINEILGWKPTVTFEELVKEMVENDINEYNSSK